jgi:hypothetical protein
VTVGTRRDDGEMSAPAAGRWSEGGTVVFAVTGLGPELAAAASRVLMDYEHDGSQWRRRYPADTPHLDQAWPIFAAHIGQVLRQAARLEPVPWREALRELCRRTFDQPVDWWLTGSAALAVRGAAITPGDLDLVCGSTDALRLGDIFADALMEPVMRAAENSISDWWGRAYCGARIEWIGDARPFVDVPDPSDFGPAAGRRLETVTFEDWRIRVPPLDLQRAVSARRGLADRVALIDTLIASQA